MFTHALLQVRPARLDFPIPLYGVSQSVRAGCLGVQSNDLFRRNL
jgi:hypothetical protein